MPTQFYILGILCICYALSRLVLFLLRGWNTSTLLRLIAAHFISALLLSVLLVLFRSLSFEAPIPYVVGQVFWFAVDWARSYRPAARTRMKNPLRGPHVGTGIAVIMVALSGIYMLRTYMAFHFDATSLGGIPVDVTPPEALYASGKPNFVRDDDRKPFSATGDPLREHVWLFTSPQMLVRFDPATNRLRSLLCIGPKQSMQTSCAPTLLVGVGNAEWDITDRLGDPTSTEIQGGMKLMRYPELGHDFVLERFAIEAIRVYARRRDPLLYFWRLIRYAIP